jgi:hypothetical protein
MKKLHYVILNIEDDKSGHTIRGGTALDVSTGGELYRAPFCLSNTIPT